MLLSLPERTSLLNDWRNSRIIPALKCSLPDEIKLAKFANQTKGEVQWRIQNPIVADIKHVKFVACSELYHPYKGRKAGLLNSTIYVVSDGLIKRYRTVFVANSGKKMLFEAKMDFSDPDVSFPSRRWDESD